MRAIRIYVARHVTAVRKQHNKYSIVTCGYGQWQHKREKARAGIGVRLTQRWSKSSHNVTKHELNNINLC